MRFSLFQNRALRVLGEAGEASTVPMSGGGRIRFLIGRGLCRFHWFEAPPSMNSGTLLAAARTFATTDAPFSDYDFALAPGANGVGVWWWDRARVTGLLPAGVAYDGSECAPETLAHVPVEGWRQARVSDGYEMQYWRGGALSVSAWRRTAWSEAPWRALLLGAGIEAAPDAPPAAYTPPYDGARLRLVRRPATGVSPWLTIERAALTLSAAILVGAAFFVGQGMRFAQEGAAAAQAHTEQRAAVSADPAIVAAARDVSFLRSYRAAYRNADALAGVFFAKELAQRHGVRVQRWSLTERTIVVWAEPAGARASLANYIDLLTKSDRFNAVTPRFSQLGESVEVRMGVRATGSSP